MAADRQLPISSTPGAVTGNNYMDAVNEEVFDLTNRAIYQLTSVSGTNTITASVEVPLVSGLTDGMRFILVPAATNTSTTVTLNLQALGAKTVLDNLGAAPRVGSLVINGKYLLEYDSGANAFYVLSYLPATTFDDRPSWRNILIDNGGFLVWQRGSTVAVAASTTQYTADRWYITTNANQVSTVSRGSFVDRSQFCALVQRNSGQTGVGTYTFSYPLTTDEIARLRTAKCTLSFRIQGGADFSPASDTVTYKLYGGQGAEGKRGGGFTSEVEIISGTVSAGTSQQNVIATSGAVVPNTTTQAELRFTWTPTGTAGANDWVIFDSVQIESGEAATQFEYAPFTFCLAMCEKHLEKTFPYATAPAQSAGVAGTLEVFDYNAHRAAIEAVTGTLGAAGASFGAVLHWRFKTRKRVSPTITTFNPSAGNANIRYSGTSTDSGAVTVGAHSDSSESGVTISAAGANAANPLLDNVGHIHALASAEL